VNADKIQQVKNIADGLSSSVTCDAKLADLLSQLCEAILEPSPALGLTSETGEDE
jgi:hypothetical protein